MATKKITELPFINTLSGSTVFDNPVLNTVIPVVLYGTTNQITVENFSKFTNLYAAQTGSQNTFTAQNIFNQNQWFNAIVSASTINVGTLGVGGNTTIVGTLGVTGNGTIGGNLVVNGKLTAQEVYTEITSASIIFESGSTKFGDDTGDKHQFTGSINVSGSVIYNGVILSNIDANTIERLQQATASIQVATASLQFHSASVDAQLLAIQQTTQSLQIATASLQAFSSSVNDQLQRVYQTTQSLHVATASLQFHSASVDSQLLRLQQTTQSLQVATASLQQFTASQDSRNFVISQYTSSTDAHIVGISTFTSSQYDTMARVYQATSSLQSTTASLNQFTASQDSRNLTLSTVTGSLIGITNGLMAFTAALDNTYATDAQLYQLYQATRSLELHSGSMIGVTNGLMAYTASNTTLNTGLRGEVDGIEAYTASLKGQAIVSSSTQIQNYDVFALNSNLYNGTGSIKAEVAGIESYTASLKSAAIVSSSTQVQNYDLFALNSNLYTSTGSLIGITNGLMAFTAALDSTYATDAQLYQLYQATQSLELTTGSLIGITNGLMAFTAALDSTYATDAQLYQLYAETASIKAEIGGIEAYTASLKGAAIVSSSQQITNYYKFAETASANHFYGNQSVSGALFVTSNSGFGSSDATGSGILKVISAGTQTAFAIGQSNSKRFTAFAANDLKVYGDDYFITTTEAFPLSLGTNSTARLTLANDGGISANGAITASNFRIGTAGGGIDFSATSNGSGTMTSELLNDYEEGTWTPTDSSGAGLTFAGTILGRYTKIGRMVTVHFRLTYPSTANASAAIIGGLPYVVNAGNNFMGGVSIWNDSSQDITLMAIDASSTFTLRRNSNNTDPANSSLSGNVVRGTLIYET